MKQAIDLFSTFSTQWQILLFGMTIFGILLILKTLVIPAVKSSHGVVSFFLLFIFSTMLGLMTFLGSIALGFFLFKNFL